MLAWNAVEQWRKAKGSAAVNFGKKVRTHYFNSVLIQVHTVSFVAIKY